MNQNVKQVHDDRMAKIVIPALAAAIQKSAEDVAHEIFPRVDPFFVDKSAERMLRELIEFLTQADCDEDLHIIHPRQLTEAHARSWWDVE